MDAELKEKWCQALESGKYKQGRYRLRTKNNEFCCLGVLYDVSEANWIDETKQSNCYGINNMGLTANLAGLGNDLDRFGITMFQQYRLWELNDSETSFAEISKWIRKNIQTDLGDV